MADVPYSLWIQYLESIWSKYGYFPKKVLDLACGTGNLSLLLTENGYDVVGLDASSHMLEIAREKVHGAEFVQAAMQDFALDTRFDAVLCVFDSLNYLLEAEDVKGAFSCVHRALNDGGYFVFDVNTPLRLSTIPLEVTLYEDFWYVVIWRDRWNPSKQWWQVDLTGFVQKDGVWQRFDEVHRERAFPLGDLTSWLTAAGFEVLDVFDAYSFIPASELTNRAYFIAKKKT